MYKPFPQGFDFPLIEKEVLEHWNKNDIFSKSISTRPASKPFVFFEGPPTANGRPGIHHVIARTMKDFVCRLKTMQGHRVERKAGWDTHGLPVEIEVEKRLNFTKKDQILDYGVDKFNQQCRESVWKYKKLWDELTERMGYWIDLEDPYVTYKNSYVESVWWILKQFWDRELIYKGHKIVPYCPRCETPLSSHEVSQGYSEIEDPSIFVKMPIKGEPDTSFLVWTTTPWTLISNAALALHPDITYVKVAHQNEKLILAEPRLEVLDDVYEVLEKKTGREYANIEYEPLFPFLNSEKRAFYTVLAQFVTTEDGSGIVHIAPAFGEDDYQTGRQFDLPFFQPIDKSGRFTTDVPEWQGEFFKKADPQIIKTIKSNGRLYKVERYRHSYPHCWRDGTPLIYYAKDSWYIQTTKFRDRLIELNKQIDWYPSEIGTGRFGEWLANNVDWALSRDRFWGTPLPVWLDEDGDSVCVGSIDELARLTGKDLSDLDLHRPYVDEITFPNPKTGKMMRRTSEVIDVWFDSGAMPVAQWHYPFENKDIFERNFPADFISEAIDQTRGWFYSLLAISTMLFDKPCYKSCAVLEMVLDKNSRKMSKSKGNVVDPFENINKYGADAVRWYLMTASPPWQTTRFDVKGIEEVVSRFLSTFKNTYAFFAMYANIDKFVYPDSLIPVEERPEIDQWLISTLNGLIANVEKNYNRYDVTRGARLIADFVVNDLSNWYVRRSRRRFWKSGMGTDKQSAFETLYESLLTVCKLAAPLAPFISEAVYLRLVDDNNLESVHLNELPTPLSAKYQYRDMDLEARMQAVRAIVLAGRSLRNAKSIKVRQPLNRIVIVTDDEKKRSDILSESGLILDELNVKEIEFVASADALMTQRAEPVFKSLGPKFGKKANTVADKIRALTQTDIQEFIANNILEVNLGDDQVKLAQEDIQIVKKQKGEFAVSDEGGWTVALDTHLNEALIAEGLARDFINRLQNMRKSTGLDIVDRIRIHYDGSEPVYNAVEKFSRYIKNETLSDELTLIRSEDNHFPNKEKWQIGNESVVISLEKI